MNYRNNPSAGDQQQFPTHGTYRHGQSQHSQSYRSKSSGFKSSGAKMVDAETSAILPVIPPPSPVVVPTQDMLPSIPTIPKDATLGELVEAAPAITKTGGFSLSSLGDIKGYIDRMGGIDGILTTVGKVQKVMSSVSQMAPLVKVLLASFKKSKDDDDGDAADWKPQRKRRRKKSAAGRKGAPKRPVAKKRRR
ncbi:hypothetical protein [Paenibacillus sp. 2TAB19]|uniref:hypothetical protein n=1 Tax=Paenibacillus sp. 2TAB19 TaxID=3233003 RepID=UPI003F98C922